MSRGAPSLGTLRLAGFELSRSHGAPRFRAVPQALVGDLDHHTSTPHGLRELCDYLGLPPLRAGELVRRTLHAIERGDVHYARRRADGVAVAAACPEPEATDLCSLAEPEPTAQTYVVELYLVDQDDHPVADQPYVVTLPDGSTREGTLDGQGRARVGGLTSAEGCEVCFPSLDADSWSYVHATPL